MMYFALIAAVLIGALIGFLLKKNNSLAKLLLTFSGGFLLSITLLHVLPDSFSYLKEKTGFYILGGVLLQIILEFLSKGAEHGHVHFNAKKSFPLWVFLGLFLHAFAEGLPLQNHKHVQLTLAVIVHKIPVALILYLAISSTIKSINKQLFLLFVFGLATPLGMLLGKELLGVYVHQLMAFVGGIFLHVSTTILFESSENHSFNYKKLAMIIIGVLLGTLV